MYLNTGGGRFLWIQNIVGFFNSKKKTITHINKDFLKRNNPERPLNTFFVMKGGQVVFSIMDTNTIKKRIKNPFGKTFYIKKEKR
jgi:hypothetical protein